MRTLYFCPVVSFYLFYSSPNISRGRLDVYHTSIHDVALVRIYNACLKSAARGSLEIQNAKKSPSAHHRTILSGISSELRHVSTIGKNLLNSNNFSTCSAIMVNFRLLTAEICWRVLGTTANFNGFRVLTALLRSTLLVGVSQTLRR